MPSSRKRTKGQERKKHAATRQQWESWTRGNTCNHGCNVIPPPEHAVSKFMNSLWEYNLGKTSSPVERMAFTFKHHNPIMRDSKLRKMAIALMLRVATDMLLDADHRNRDIDGGGEAVEILLLEECDGVDFYSTVMKSWGSIRDLTGGGEREMIKFFHKRIQCTCLTNLYMNAKKSQPVKLGTCDCCNEKKDRRSLLLCGRCRSVNYCNKHCQATHYAEHESICRSIDALD